MDSERDPTVGNAVCIMVTEAVEAIRITVTTVIEITDLVIVVMGNIRETIGIMIGLVTEGITSIKVRGCPNVMSGEEQDAVLQLLAQEEQVEALSHLDLSDLNL